MITLHISLNDGKLISSTLKQKELCTNKNKTKLNGAKKKTKKRGNEALQQAD